MMNRVFLAKCYYYKEKSKKSVFFTVKKSGSQYRHQVVKADITRKGTNQPRVLLAGMQ